MKKALLVTAALVPRPMGVASRENYRSKPINGERRAAVAAWFAEPMETMTTIDLCCGCGFGATYRQS